MAEILYKDESYKIRGATFDVYKKFRNRHKEIIYQRSLAQSLENQGLAITREHQIPIFYLDKKVGTYTPDIVVENKIFIEVKAKPFLHRDDVLQFWYYLKSSDFKVGYLINFGAPNGVQIIRRVYDSARKV